MKIYLAGSENGDTIPIVGAKLIPNGFVSYYYLRGTKENELIQFLRANIKNVIIDSGAHTFFSENTDKNMSAGVIKKHTKTKESPDEYWEKYKNWIVRNYNFFDYYVELDIGELVGQGKVLQWREELKRLGVFKKCITVVHPEIVSFDDYLQMIKDSQSRYIGLEGDRKYRHRLNYNKYLKVAYENKVKIHGFAMTKLDALKTFPFYSVDSISWKAGVMHGKFKAITSKGYKTVSFKDKNDLFIIKGSNILQMTDKNLKSQRYKILELAIDYYKEIQDYFTKLWTKRGIDYESF